MQQPDDDHADSEPFGKACDRLTAAGLWPPIVGFDMDWDNVDEAGEPLNEIAEILHQQDLSPEVRDQIHGLMGGLPYKLTRVTQSGHEIVDRDGRVRGGWLYAPRSATES